MASGGGESPGLTELVEALMNPAEREVALQELSKRREEFPDLAPCIWHTPTFLTILLSEIVAVYPSLSPATLTQAASTRVCNALALMQVAASRIETRDLFLAANIPMYLFPFLGTKTRSRPFQYLRLTSLGVIGALVKHDDSSVVMYLLSTECIPLCLRIMEGDSELSRTVATFIVQKILLDKKGLAYVCLTQERFLAVATVLSSMCTTLVEEPSPRLLKHIVQCYLHLSESARAREALRTCIPASLRRGGPLHKMLQTDDTVAEELDRLLRVVFAEGPPSSMPMPPASMSMPMGGGAMGPTSAPMDMSRMGPPAHHPGPPHHHPSHGPPPPAGHPALRMPGHP